MKTFYKPNSVLISSLLIIILVVFNKQVYSQNITFTFSGKNSLTNNPMPIDKVDITNETNGTDTTIIGNTFTTIKTSINLSENMGNPEIEAYPNPFNEEIIFSFNSNEHEKGQISLYTVDGKKIAGWNGNFGIGESKFRLKSGVRGILLLRIESPNIQLHTKLICLRSAHATAIEILNSQYESQNMNKSASDVNSGFVFRLGDRLKFKGYSGPVVSEEIIDSPGKNSNYSLVFDVSDYVPVTNFIASSTNLNLGDTVIFNDKSSNSPTSWIWDFGDGNTSNQQNPEHKYANPGNYTVSLIAGNSYGNDTIVKTGFITINPAYYNLRKHHIATSFPSFVNILFSVEDENNNGVSYLVNDDFEVFEDNSTVSPTETFMYVKKSNTVPFMIKTVLLLDNSSSVRENLESIKSAAIKLIDNKTEKQEIAVYSFSSNPTLIQDFTSNKDSLIAAINSISLGYPSTNLYGSIITAVNRWQDIYSTAYIQQGFLVALTDGDDTQSSSTLSQAINAVGNKKTYMIGLGNEINPEALNRLANPGPYYPITDINTLGSTFEEIQNDILRQANSFYWLTYMSPKRTGSHQLLLQMKENRNTSSSRYISDDFSASDFSDVMYGVYANVSKDKPYGVDTIIIDNDNSEIKLTATTYWAENPPEYRWKEKTNDGLFIIPDALDPHSVTISSNNNPFFNTTILLEDIANSYSKEIYVILKINQPTLWVNSISAIDSIQGSVKITSVLKYLASGSFSSSGIVWSLNNIPTIENNIGITNDGIVFGMSVNNINGLDSKNTYFVRVYMIINQVTFYSPLAKFNSKGMLFTDVRDRNSYNVTQIGTQSWMVQNLAYLPSVSPSSGGEYVYPRYYVYGYEGTDVNDAKLNSNYTDYGVLYNWRAAYYACPQGWHLPSDDEWKKLEIALGMNQAHADESNSYRGTDQGMQMKSTSGWSGNGNGNNFSSFSGLPGGLCWTGTEFTSIGREGLWWSSTQTLTDGPWCRILSYEETKVGRYNYYDEHHGFSIRCVRDY